MLHHVHVPHFFPQICGPRNGIENDVVGPKLWSQIPQIPRIFGGENGKICDGWIT